jgi:DNA polymerase/3'-5' exonuclease PolX
MVVQLIDNKDNIIKTFNTLTDCAKFLGWSVPAASYRLKKQSLFNFENKLVYIKRVADPSKD